MTTYQKFCLAQFLVAVFVLVGGITALILHMERDIFLILTGVAAVNVLTRIVARRLVKEE